MDGTPKKAGLFPQTRWSLVQRAQGVQGRRALGELLETYWRPLYLMGRCCDLSADEASDAVQSFMVRLLERDDFVERLNPERGRLRSYLKTAFRHFLDNERARVAASKRGGGMKWVDFDVEMAESLRDEHQLDPEAVFEREWAAGIFETALGQLRAEYERGSRGGPFSLVERYFSGQVDGGYRQVSGEFKMSEAQLKSFLHRARKRYRELLHELVSDTIDPSEEDASISAANELTQLQAALTR